MSTSTLMTHSPKFQSKLTSMAALTAMPQPQAQGIRHKPVPHVVLVDHIREEIDRRGWQVGRQALALSQNGQAIFGVMDLEVKPGTLIHVKDRGISFGFRSSVNETLAIKAVAGTRVFVCDNLALSGDMIAIQRKSTTGLDLKQAVAEGFDKFIEHQAVLEVSIARMATQGIGDVQAKCLIFDLLNMGVIPSRLFDDVVRNYFKPTPDMVDCQPRTLWGLHNAVTRAIRDLTPVRGFNATQDLGRVFDGVVIDAVAA
jgi:hypothetical protein